MLLHHFDFWSVADHLPLLRFVEHSSQCPQSTVGICSRARKFQLLGAIACDLVHSQTHNRCRLQQPPAVKVGLSRHFFQPGSIRPSQKPLSKVTESGGRALKWIGFSITEASIRLAILIALTGFVSFVDAR